MGSRCRSAFGLLNLSKVFRTGNRQLGMLPQHQCHQNQMQLVPVPAPAPAMSMSGQTLTLLKNFSTNPPSPAASEQQLQRQHQEISASASSGSKNDSELDCSSSSTSTSSSGIDDSWYILPDKLYSTIEIEILGYEPNVLNSYQWFVLTAASHLGISVERVYEPRKSDKWRFNLLKSAFVHKKHQVHYEVRTYHRFITLVKLTGSTASTYLEYIQRNIPESVGMKVTKVEVLPLPDSLK